MPPSPMVKALSTSFPQSPADNFPCHLKTVTHLPLSLPSWNVHTATNLPEQHYNMPIHQCAGVESQRILSCHRPISNERTCKTPLSLCVSDLEISPAGQSFSSFYLAYFFTPKFLYLDNPAVTSIGLYTLSPSVSPQSHTRPVHSFKPSPVVRLFPFLQDLLLACHYYYSYYRSSSLRILLSLPLFL